MQKQTKIAPAIEAEAITHKEIIPVENQIVKSDADIDGFLVKRKEFIEKVSAICVEGKDFHVIQGKKSLAKGGAEKIASIFNWKANFHQDKETMEMLGDLKGTLVYVCTLFKMSQSWNEDRDNVGEGRGAATLQKNGGDVNKTIKMAQKSAFIDAVLRASGLSDFFTQDLEDMPREQIGQPEYTHGGNLVEKPQPVKDIPASEKQLKLIADLMHQKGFTKEDILNEGYGKLTGGKGGTASELIEFLFNAKTKVTPNGLNIPYQADPAKDLPVIQQEMTVEEKALVDQLDF